MSLETKQDTSKKRWKKCKLSLINVANKWWTLIKSTECHLNLSSNYRMRLSISRIKHQRIISINLDCSSLEVIQRKLKKITLFKEGWLLITKSMKAGTLLRSNLLTKMKSWLLSSLHLNPWCMVCSKIYMVHPSFRVPSHLHKDKESTWEQTRRIITL
jgi:hypothetical protein